MNKKALSLVGIVVVIVLAGVGWYLLFAQQPTILAAARLRYNQAVNSQQDLSAGPCLGQIAPDWVLDIAHLPRQPIDDLPQNQCADYSQGIAHHFAEMSPRGEIIRVQ